MKGRQERKAEKEAAFVVGRMTTLGVLSLVWLGLYGGTLWVILKRTQDLPLTILSAGSLALLAATIGLLLRQFTLTGKQAHHLQSLQAEWQATQESLRHLLSQRDQLGHLVQLLHRFVLATKPQEVVVALLQELPFFLRLSRMEVALLEGATILWLWEARNPQIRIENLANFNEALPSWLSRPPSKTLWQENGALLVPVTTDDHVIALLRLERPEPFSSDEIRFLEIVASQSALALERVRLISFLENLSITDALTGIANRRHLEWRLSEEIERARRYRYPLSLLMVDIDHFKQINDTYGHQVGDAVLQQLAYRLRNTLRRTDFVARYGGEEFIVLAPQTPVDRALILAERLRQRIASEPILVASDLSLPVTVSVGVAVFPDHAQNESELVRAADAALYRAKQAGRNCVRVFEPNKSQGGDGNVWT